MAYLAALLYRLHVVTGLVAGLFFSILGVTGAALAFRPALEQSWYIPKSAATANSFSWDQVALHVSQGPPGRRIREARLRPGHATEFVVHNRDGSAATSHYVDPASGRVLAERNHDSSPFEALRSWHTHLSAGPYGRILVSRLGLLLMLQAIIGAVIWILRGKPGNWHTYLGLAALMPLLLLAYSGFHVMTTRFTVVTPVVTLRGVENKAPLDTIVATATKRRQGFELTRIDFPQAPSQPFAFWFGDQNPERVVYMDPYGAVLPMMIPTQLNQVQLWHSGPAGGAPAAFFRLLTGLAIPLLWTIALWRHWQSRRSRNA
ncbi:hypothetical protein F183_A48980 [Bryobacterales bacterium F-183]|nr:hypothetical protein F183_A48980 [Bryobacterales bacterium F-183]